MITPFARLIVVLAVAVVNAQAAFYVDWSTSVCVDDSRNRPWDELFGSLQECCTKALWWKADCITESLKRTKRPTRRPTKKPTEEPSARPTHVPSPYPSPTPSLHPSGHPTPAPTLYPSELPTSTPTTQPSMNPSQQPSKRPTLTPSLGPTNTRELEIGPVADAYISESRPSKNFGNKGALHARAAKNGSRESLLKFDLSPLRGKCIKKATLSLYSLVDAQGGGIIMTLVPKKDNLFARVNRWKEDETTWILIKSKTKGSNVKKRIGRVRKNSWVETDVTVGIRKKNGYQTFCVASSGPKVAYASKEKRPFAPKLTVVFC